MPTYTFQDETTGELFDEIMSYSEKVDFLNQNPTYKSILNSLNIVAGVGGIRNDDGWTEVLQKVSEAHPSSELASRYDRKSATEVKTENAVAKWRKQRNE